MKRWQGALVVALVVGAMYVLADTSLIERAHVLLSPSAQRAYAYGMRHFSSQDAAAYDIETAKYFFLYAARVQPDYPYVHHQLSRVYFLKGEYPQALEEANAEIANDPTRASTYYLRGLIEGYLQQYEAAVRDYRQYVAMDPDRWEGRVDLTWVLIKTGRFEEALETLNAGLAMHPENPWLMSMKASVLVEMGRPSEALPLARLAAAGMDALTESQWLEAYPGNAPEAARTGIETLRTAARMNLEKIEAMVKRP